MPLRDPILDYRPPASRLPLYPAVILMLWSIFALSLSILFAAFVSSLGSYDSAVCGLLFVFDVALLAWSAVNFILGINILKSNITSLHRALRVTILIEFAWWIVFLAFCALAFFFTWSEYSKISDWLPPLLIILPISIALTTTHLLLRRAAREFPAP